MSVDVIYELEQDPEGYASRPDLFARNLTRDIEWLLPLIAILDSRVLGIDSPALLVVCWLWLGVMAFLPLLNRYHSRVGDLVAGTLVVAAPGA